jgi:hypothetical protein
VARHRGAGWGDFLLPVLTTTRHHYMCSPSTRRATEEGLSENGKEEGAGGRDWGKEGRGPGGGTCECDQPAIGQSRTKEETAQSGNMGEAE